MYVTSLFQIPRGSLQRWALSARNIFAVLLVCSISLGRGRGCPIDLAFWTRQRMLPCTSLHLSTPWFRAQENYSQQTKERKSLVRSSINPAYGVL
jgi:hypothetical protein